MTTVRTSSLASSSSSSSSSPVSLEGLLEKKGSLTSKKYWCCLNDTKLSYYNPGVKDAKNQTECGSLVIQHIQSVRSGKGTTFEIIMQSKTHIFTATENELRDKWVTAVRDAMSIVNRRASTYSTSQHMSLVSQRSDDVEGRDSVFTDSDVTSPPTVSPSPKFVNGGSVPKQTSPSRPTSPPVIKSPHSTLPKPWTPQVAGIGPSKVVAPTSVVKGNIEVQGPEKRSTVDKTGERISPDKVTSPSPFDVTLPAVVHQSNDQTGSDASSDPVEVDTPPPSGNAVTRESCDPTRNSEDESSESNEYDGYLNRYDIEKSLGMDKMNTEEISTTRESVGQPNNLTDCNSSPSWENPVAPPRKSRNFSSSVVIQLITSDSEPELVIGQKVEPTTECDPVRVSTSLKTVPENSSSLPVVAQKPRITSVKPSIAGVKPSIPSQKPIINVPKAKIVDLKSSQVVSKPPTNSEYNGGVVRSLPASQPVPPTIQVPVPPTIQVPTPPTIQIPAQVRTRETALRQSVPKSIVTPSPALPRASDVLELDVNLPRKPILDLRHGPLGLNAVSAFDDIKSLLRGMATHKNYSKNERLEPGRAVEDMRRFLAYKL